MHTVAAGFVHLSSWTDDDVARYLAGPLEASTSHTLTEPAAITARIEEVRSTGYAWTAEEWADGINGAAAPIETTQAVRSVPSTSTAPRTASQVELILQRLASG